MDPMPLVELLDTVPDSIWGALVGAMVALIPVVITNRHSRKLQAQQLEFESRERQRERHASMRRDVYLPAADAFTGLVAGMSRLLSVDVPDQDIADRAQAFGASLTRIQMVASPETIRRVAELQREYIGTIATLQQKRHPMKMRQLQIDIAADVVKSYDDQLDAFDKAGERLISGTASSDDVDRYMDALHQVRRVSDRRDEARIDWLRQLLAQEMARADMAREFVRRMEVLFKLQTPLLAAIRRELETDEALQLIAEEAEKTSAVGVRTVSDLIPAIEGTIEEMRRDLGHLEQQKLTKAEQAR